MSTHANRIHKKLKSAGLLSGLFASGGTRLEYLDVTFEETAQGVTVSLQNPLQAEALLTKATVNSALQEGFQYAVGVYEQATGKKAEIQGWFALASHPRHENTINAKKTTWHLSLEVK